MPNPTSEATRLAYGDFSMRANGRIQTDYARHFFRSDWKHVVRHPGSSVGASEALAVIIAPPAQPWACGVVPRSTDAQALMAPFRVLSRGSRAQGKSRIQIAQPLGKCLCPAKFSASPIRSPLSWRLPTKPRHWPAGYPDGRRHCASSASGCPLMRSTLLPASRRSTTHCRLEQYRAPDRATDRLPNAHSNRRTGAAEHCHYSLPDCASAERRATMDRSARASPCG